MFKEGDYVLIHNDHKKDKLDTEWLGPYRFHQIKTPYYEILIDNVIKKVTVTVRKIIFQDDHRNVRSRSKFTRYTIRSQFQTVKESNYKVKTIKLSTSKHYKYFTREIRYEIL